VTQTLTDREADLMQVLWDHGPGSVAEVRLHLKDLLARNTVLTMLNILEQKGFVRHEALGRTHRYFAVVPEQTARRNAVRHLVGKMFRGSTELLCTHLVTGGALSASDIRRLKQLIADSQRKPGGKR
jgi:predicted transcriptional regulator